MNKLLNDAIKDRKADFFNYALSKEDKPVETLTELLENAFYHFDYDSISFLLDQGACLEEGSIALLRVIDDNNNDILKLYFSKHKLSQEEYNEESEDLKSDYVSCLTEHAAHDASLETLQSLIKAGYPFTYPSIMLRASHGNNVEVAEYALTELLKQNAEDVIAKAFDVAFERKNHEILELIASSTQDETQKERVNGLRSFTEILVMAKNLVNQFEENKKVDSELLRKFQNILKDFKV